MGHSIGDGIIVLALAAAFLGYFYLKHLERQRRLEIVHQERLAAMDKGIPLPELPIDPPRVQAPPDPRIPLILGIVLLAVGGGAMAAFSLVSGDSIHMFWPMPLPLALVGVGLMLYYFLAQNR
jgi:hypothetical protein